MAKNLEGSPNGTKPWEELSEEEVVELGTGLMNGNYVDQPQIDFIKRLINIIEEGSKTSYAMR